MEGECWFHKDFSCRKLITFEAITIPPFQQNKREVRTYFCWVMPKNYFLEKWLNFETIWTPPTKHVKSPHLLLLGNVKYSFVDEIICFQRKSDKKSRHEKVYKLLYKVGYILLRFVIPSNILGMFDKKAIDKNVDYFSLNIRRS